MKILVTGETVFMGSLLSKDLCLAGHEVTGRGSDNKYCDPELKFRRLSRIFGISLQVFSSRNFIRSTFNTNYRIQVAGLMFFNVYGSWGSPDMALWIFTKSFLENTKIKLFNNGNHLTISVRQFISHIGGRTGKKELIENHPMQQCDVCVTYGDVGQLYRKTGFRPTNPVSEGINEFVKWFIAGHSNSRVKYPGLI